MIAFHAGISQHHSSYFANHSTLIDYLRACLNTICNSARGYKFLICFWSDEVEICAIATVISSILQMPPVKRCENVAIEIPLPRQVQRALPVEAISNWLEKSSDEMQINDRKPKEKFLKIRADGIQNYRELIDCLKMVFLIDFINKF